MRQLVVLLSTFLSACILSGCIGTKTYRADLPTEEVPPTPIFGSDSARLPPGPLCLAKVSSDFKNPCVAYIEFNDSGQLQTPQTDQVGKALSLIKAASTPRPGEISQPIIMVFAHGWKHNAEGGIFEDSERPGAQGFP